MGVAVTEISKTVSIINEEELPGFVDRLNKSGLVFGILKNSNAKSYSVSICHLSDVYRISEIRQLADFQNFPGFVAFPFDGKNKSGYFLPNTIEPSEISVFQSDKGKDGPGPIVSTSSEHYKKGVRSAVQSISEGKFQKLVISRKLEISAKIENLALVVSKLIESYPESHLCIFSIPDQGLWISVSPEILVQKESESQIIETMALAGTMKFEGQNLKGHGWTEKEIEEQALVSRFIKEKLIESGYLEFEEKGPFTIQAGNLIHLRTDYKVRTQKSEGLFELAEALHPTSAVCGSPREAAMDWLNGHEDFDREFFSGFGGIIGPDFGKLVVLLRTAKIKDGKISLFSGAGITECSNPDSEWLETEEKLKTLLEVLK